MVESGLVGRDGVCGGPARPTPENSENDALPLLLPPRSEPLSSAVRAALGLTDAGAEIVQRIRVGDPVRRPAPGSQNWAGREYLDLMGFTVGVESRTLERAFYRLVPRQKDLLEIYDQPYFLRRSVKLRNGRALSPRDHAPEALCIRTARVHFTECKPWHWLLAIQEKYPDKFCLGENGRWRSPAAERALEGTGIGYEVFSDKDINPTLLRNVNFLRDFEREPSPSPELVAPVIAALARDPILTLDALFDLLGDRRVVYLAIAHRIAFFDLGRDLVIEDRSPIYREEAMWEADKVVRARQPRPTVEAPAFCPEPGAPIKFRGRDAQVLTADAQGLWIRTEEGDCPFVPTDAIVPMLCTHRLEVPRTNSPLGALARARLKRATTQELDRAIAAYRSIEPWITGGRRGGASRTDRRRIRLFRAAETVFGQGLVGLLDRTRLRGNRTDRLSQQQERTIEEFIQSEYLNAARSIDATLARINPALTSMGEERVGRRALKRRIDKIPAEERERRRHGTRMANAARAPHAQTDQPAKGERAFEVGMIDSFSVPMKTYSRRTEQIIDTPMWGTLLWNVFPPKPLGLALQFEKPSTRAVMAAIRDCVRRHNRLPDNIYCDLGSEHGSLTFDLLEVEYGVNVLKRPMGNPRFGADIEAHIGAFKEKVREYQGSYKRIPRRGGTATHSPEAVSKWYWEDFCEDFRHFVFVDWPDMEHEGISVKPKVLWQKSIADQGSRPQRHIPYDDNFVVLTMPIVKNAATIHPTRGVRYQYVWYHAPELDDPRWHEEHVTLREPVDEAHIIVQLGASWVRCEPVSYVFRLFSHREQRLLLEEWRAEARQSNSRERLTPEAYERFINRIAEKEGRFDRPRAEADSQPLGEAAVAPVATTPTKEAADDLTFSADPVL